MKLYTSARAPNPRRVAMFIAEKGITGIDTELVDLGALQNRSPEFLAVNPFGRVPALALDDGRVLSETRAICTYLEGVYPEPNLMGDGYDDRAFIEMADRRIELYLFAGIANCIRHTHPGLAPLEQPQFADFGTSQGEKMRDTVRWLDGVLATQPYVAGQRFTIADITAFCALEFARGLMKFRPGAEGFEHVQAWRDRIAARPGASAG
ncbi:glutathione S-transferase family protein [Duganella sp. FT92W]|uniref:Glutathione S-transferase family protein n=1 Tax=Pseudoduganella rivuli TaxID=2666085 RepID=A0A7X2LYC3_9BURK|nr:glutathione S-transferase family protein [Pseudoduganella rivuli]MRV76829.1 glutathione S-transferase family protein [Pseudoduganella rivuli]